MSRVPREITKEHILSALWNIERWIRYVRAALDKSDCMKITDYGEVSENDSDPIAKIWDCPGEVGDRKIWDCPGDLVPVDDAGKKKEKKDKKDKKKKKKKDKQKLKAR